MTGGGGSGTIAPNKAAAGDGVQKYGELRSGEIEAEFGELNTREIILTNERVLHIKEHHPQDYTLFKEYGQKTVMDPDIIVRDMKNEGTVFMITRLEKTNLNAIIRLSVANSDNPGLLNSIMTFYRIRTKNLVKLMEKHKVLYNRL